MIHPRVLSCKMANSVYITVIVSLVIFYPVLADQCIFSTFNGVKVSAAIVVSYVVEDSHSSCQFMCYNKPSKCTAANIVVYDNSSYLCEFFYLQPGQSNNLVKEPNPEGKFISRNEGRK